MKIKKTISSILLSIVLASCVSAAVSPASPTPAPTFTPTFTPTIVPVTNTPTQVPPTPTETQVPTPEVKVHEPTMIDFECTADIGLDKVQKSNVYLGKDVRLSRWIPCTLPDGKVVAINMVVEDWQQGKVYFTFSLMGSSGPKGQGFGDGETVAQSSNGIAWGIIGMEENMFNHLKIEGKKVRLLHTTGNMSSSLLPNMDAFKNILTGRLADRMITFAETGDPSVLPTYSELPYPLVLIYRTEIIEILPD